jgi:hypothetical protein
MSNKPNPRPNRVQETAAVSLVAAVACALSGEAMASWPAAETKVGALELSARVATIVETVRLGEPALLRDLPLTTKMAQWRNR